jgi:hypothetical protein
MTAAARHTSPKRQRRDTLSPRWRVGLVSRRAAHGDAVMLPSRDVAGQLYVPLTPADLRAA